MDRENEPSGYPVSVEEGIKDVLEGSTPCSPEQVQYGDVVIAVVQLGVRVSLRYIFENQVPPEGHHQSREVRGLQVLQPYLEADRSLRRELCDEAIDDLEDRFSSVISPSSMNMLRIYIGNALLDGEDPFRPMPLEMFPPDVVHVNLLSFLTMDLSRFDKLGRMVQ